ncbi:hypothetical protein OWR29_25895 [Actinoplanes sp. Pm04-4]|uniref:Prenyltransferase alpha-alpha toroid domain-containing protein n=1 Tax=Paractinoplanes pyxinae TaxID=2997416 RepID=A0ABT4B4K8_9ACTN|nr:prenyltransferase/squalene oxidase repeat-containing protein [Actinoplanes pyxinae]MCY1141444.1 hypothetical protein [Actinoplanes pyxinae]
MPVPDRAAVERYVESCYQGDSNGFTLTPGGDSSLHAIAEGHVALVMLGHTEPHWTKNLSQLVKPLVHDLMDVWIASAFLNTAGVRSSDAARWEAMVLGARNPDGTWGAGQDRAVQTAMHASSLLLLGVPLPEPAMVRQTIIGAQTAEGGWGDGDSDGKATLAATYRIARVVRALSLPVDTTAATAFVESCRKTDGSYTGQPDAGSTGGDLVNTYLALTIDRWLNDPAAPGIN